MNAGVQPGVRKSRVSDFALVLIALLFVTFGGLGLTQDLGLRKYWFGLTDEAERVRVGKLSGLNGGSDLKRQKAQDLEFRSLPLQAELFNGDTLVTDEKTSAVLEFDDGGHLEIEPGSMVQLVFETTYGWSGIDRLWDLRVVQGGVTARAAAVPIRLSTSQERLVIRDAAPKKLQVLRPMAVAPNIANAEPPQPPIPQSLPVAQSRPAVVAPPKPVAVKAEILSPAPGVQLVVPPGKVARELRVLFQVSLKGSDLKQLKIRVNQGGSARSIYEKSGPISNGLFATSWIAKSPGSYQWEVFNADGGALLVQGKPLKAEFKIHPVIEGGIELLDPLVAGKILSSNQLQGDQVQNFSVTLRWRSKLPTQRYDLWFGDKPGAARPLLTKTVNRPEYLFNKDRIFAGEVYYRVSAPVGQGWIVTSGDHKFAFNFLPPILVVPPSGTVMQKDPSDPEATILFTWQKTNFTTGYELQLSQDIEFKKILFSKALKDNLYVLPQPSPGHYYWRVRAYNKDLSSSYGQASEFDIK